ncbi:MAG: hypothetical protein WCK57_06295 [Verrucomicrobiae bacterium]
MKLTKLADTGLSQEKDVAGLLSCRIDYELKSGKGQIDYTGPKFDSAMWHEVLSFFRWTHKEMDSESQVRLYVNTKLGRWGAWAFPQEARTGMSAREIATPETPEQAVARFASWGSEPSGDWLYFATVHHHCSASAFQSSTDEANERNQDGLHLTVGRMDAERHDLHARFYLNGNCFAPDLSRFWPVDPALAEQVPPTLHDELARFQMGEKVVVDFPDVWRKHVVEVLANGHQADRHQRGIQLQRWPDDEWPNPHRLDQPVWIRTGHAVREISDRCSASSLTDEDFVVALQSIAENPAASLIVAACLKHQVTPEELLGEVQTSEAGYESGF